MGAADLVNVLQTLKLTEWKNAGLYWDMAIPVIQPLFDQSNQLMKGVRETGKLRPEGIETENSKLCMFRKIFIYVKKNESKTFMSEKSSKYFRFIYLFKKIIIWFGGALMKPASSPNSPDTTCKVNIHRTFRTRPRSLLNVLCTFNLRPVSRKIVLMHLCGTEEKTCSFE